MNLRLFNYPGNKFRVLEWILPQVVAAKEVQGHDIYVEPFFGSGNVWLNVPKDFSEYHVGDTVPYTMAFFKRLNDPDSYCKLMAEIARIFILWPVMPPSGLKRKLVKHAKLDPASRYIFDVLKENYYTYRTEWNKTRRKVDSVSTIAGFAYLCGACINNLVRFSKDGDFNQGWGQRCFDLDVVPNVREAIGPIMSKTSLMVQHFDHLLSNLDADHKLKRCVVYLDPPYGTRTEADVNGLYDLGSAWTPLNDARVVYWCKRIYEAGGAFVLSNILENPSILELTTFKMFNVQRVPIKYKASVGKHEARQQTEVLISNVDNIHRQGLILRGCVGLGEGFSVD
jgi:site-specific DNA-adenine methylase